MVERARGFAAVHVDFGTGDGAFVRHTAAARPGTLVLGVDAAGEGLREVSRRVAAKPARGGLANALFGRMGLDEAPGALAGIADQLTVLLPWGSLLRAVARPDPGPLQQLRAMCKKGAALRVVFGYGDDGDQAAIRQLGLPDVQMLIGDAQARSAVHASYRAAGFVVSARELSVDQVRALPTTWAKRLAFSGRARRFVVIDGRAQ